MTDNGNPFMGRRARRTILLCLIALSGASAQTPGQFIGPDGKPIVRAPQHLIGPSGQIIDAPPAQPPIILLQTRARPGWLRWQASVHRMREKEEAVASASKSSLEAKWP